MGSDGVPLGGSRPPCRLYEQLYDRCYLVHTTYIPYAEFSSVLGMNGIDAYIEYGGTMSVGGANCNEKFSLFSGSRRTNEYIDSAIARNIPKLEIPASV